MPINEHTKWIVQTHAHLFLYSIGNYTLLTSVVLFSLSLSFPLSDTEFPEEIDVSS